MDAIIVTQIDSGNSGSQNAPAISSQHRTPALSPTYEALPKQTMQTVKARSHARGVVVETLLP